MFSGGLGVMDIILIVAFVVGAIVVGLYFLNRWAGKRVTEQQDIIDKTKQLVSIYVIDKKKAKASSANFPKAVMDSLPKWYRLLKVPLVKAKIGPQIMTLMCDKKVFEALPVKRNAKVELAGIYIVSMKGMKSNEEMKSLKKAKAGDEKPWYLFWKK